MWTATVLSVALFLPAIPGGPKKGKKLPLLKDGGDLSGYYVCRGKEAGGKAYSGVCVLRKVNQVYVVQWVIGAGSNFTGVGIRQGDRLAVSWSISGERGLIRGINSYKIHPGPRLVGRWTSLPGPGVLMDETLTFLKAMEGKK